MAMKSGAHSRPNVPPGNDKSGEWIDVPRNVAKHVPMQGPVSDREDDHIALNSLEKNAPVDPGHGENHEIAPAIEPETAPDKYQSGGSNFHPLW